MRLRPGHRGTGVLPAVGLAPLSRDARADPRWQEDSWTGEEVGQMRTSPEIDESTPAEDEQAPPRLRVAPATTDGEPVPIARSEVPAMGEE